MDALSTTIDMLEKLIAHVKATGSLAPTHVKTLTMLLSMLQRKAARFNSL